jgi:hypothetical protein
MHPPLEGIGKGVGRRADEHLGGPSSSAPLRNLPSSRIFLTMVAIKLHGVDVEHALGLGVVAELLVVARQAEHVLIPWAVGAQNVACMAMRLRSRQTI